MVGVLFLYDGRISRDWCFFVPSSGSSFMGRGMTIDDVLVICFPALSGVHSVCIDIMYAGRDNNWYILDAREVKSFLDHEWLFVWVELLALINALDCAIHVLLLIPKWLKLSTLLLSA
ncbi:hypothetical protein BDR04DRAFT_1101116 [Suillus decipiens]|nr:hypothetical protein BDR04DRAFT_1101116 [Suillus decipiens]